LISFRGSRGNSDSTGISAELVRKSEITGNSHRCNSFLSLFEKLRTPKKM
jgi:hypothetical protein